MKKSNRSVGSAKAGMLVAASLATGSIGVAGDATAQALPDLTGVRVLWMGAHPDDQILAAPLLRQVCVSQNATCIFWDMTVQPQQRISEQFAALQEHFAMAAANYYHGPFSSTAGPSTAPETILNQWVLDAGLETQDELFDAAADVIANLGADFIITFDPRHGSTCHPEHRAAAEIVRRGVPRMSESVPTVYLVASEFNGTATASLETILDPPPGTWFGLQPVVPGSSANLFYDAYVTGTWPVIKAYIEDIPFSLDPAHANAFGLTPPESQINVFQLLSDFDGEDPAYEGLCETSPDWP